MSPKLKTAVLAIVVPFVLTLIKLAASAATMSLSILASALDSLTDTISQAINFAAIKTSEMPADEKHQYGHGKAEAIAGLVQAAFIGFTAVFLIYRASVKIVGGYRLESESIGIYVMLISLVASIILAYVLSKVGKRTESTALTASALNFGADVWTNAGVLVALALEGWWHVENADPIISILISLYIFVSAIRIAKDAISQLMDKTLPSEMLTIIDECIMAQGESIHGYHNLRTRRVGSEKHIEFHLEVKNTLSFNDAHELTETIIAAIKARISNAHVMAHPDPWESNEQNA